MPSPGTKEDQIMSDERGDAAGYLGWFFLGALAGAMPAASAMRLRITDALRRN